MATKASKKITWKTRLAVNELAGIIAGAMSSGVRLVIGSVKLAILNEISEFSKGGTLYWTRWYHVNVLNYHYKVDWVLSTSVKRYGTYSFQYTTE